MSRSFKRPWVKDSGTYMKRRGARMERRTVRQLLKPWRNNYYMSSERGCYGCECREWGLSCDFERMPIEPTLPLRKEIVNSYDICDWRFYRPDNPYYYRK